MGSYLRTNYRISGKELDINAIGGGVPLSSWAGGAGTRREFGGFVMGSVAPACVSYVSLAPSNVMQSYYGAGMFPVSEGHKFVPIAFQLRVPGEGGSTSIQGLWASLTGSVAMVFAAGSGLSVLTSDLTMGFTYAGFIVSSP